MFERGKKRTTELERFQYFLEDNLTKLHQDLISNNYQHGGYHYFMVCDNKKRKIAVASIRDRVVHRLVYEYLVSVFNNPFIYDAWSCRRKKGLFGAIERTQHFLKKYPNYYVWRTDIKQFFNSVDQEILLNIIKRKVLAAQALNLIRKIIESFGKESKIGLPIGNLTSQIFANIYLNELDRFVKFNLKIKGYLRYGDDFVVFSKNRNNLIKIRREVIAFLSNNLRLSINQKNEIIIKARAGLFFLGAKIYPKGRVLNKRNWQRIRSHLAWNNYSSYYGNIKKNQPEKLNYFEWLILEEIIDERNLSR